MAETENKASEQFDVFERQSAVLEEQSEQASDRELEQQDWQNRVERNAMRHVANLVGNHADRTDVEYQKARLERVILVGVWSSYETTQTQAEESLRELAALADTAGAEVVDGLLQRRDHPDAATYIGSGKAKELAQMVESNDADTIIVNADLPPSQRRALEKLTGIHVIDRTAVILDIFAQHATSREGKAQVELAQLQYMLPRLRGWGQTLSRQAGGQSAGQMGGIGSRGPGETKLEMNRRVIHKRISKLKADIAAMEPTRRTKRDSRRRNDIPTVSVVGYTNAGKSSLTNALTGSQELVRNALFATLDTAVRSAKTRSGRTYAYADTVGFVSDLPTQLVEAFKSTLEEISSSDVILHVVDASSLDVDAHISTVNEILADIDGVEQIPRLLAFNKVDLITQAQLHRLKELYPDAAFVSATSGVGIEQLQHAVEALLPRPHVRVDVLLPYDAGALVAQVRMAGQIEQLDYEDEGIHLQAFVGDSLAAKLLAASQ
ncbi:GTPase HflX [Aeriscardovia aeriphila]|uniref:GTPase HflX n=1 Tax=Aeriscardovia aeriphila TaxID=218139 RepID=A0A261FAP7_9BIFI|nr:GTPase HflX [Aeriscardovia aeriphila]NYI25615.1 GTP-binding protein HflX [Aeriscardovia aeriphila]OZG56237.1 GTP-binding protein [Aeriscardovia aeriphila]